MKAVNLIPADQRGGAGPAAGRSQGGAYAVPVLLAGLGILTLFYGTARHEISARRAQSASLATQAQQAQAKATELTPYTTFVKLQEERVQAVTALAASRFDWSYAFHELGRVLPLSASISSLSGTVGAATTTTSSSSGTPAKAATVTSATPPGSVPVFVISGCAISQSEVAHTLSRLRQIDGVSEVTLQSSTKPAGSASSGGGGGGCPGTDPTFAMTITFTPLPAAPSGGGSTATAATAANTSIGAGG
jgi:Tfp pilus assembly protein PilN